MRMGTRTFYCSRIARGTLGLDCCAVVVVGTFAPYVYGEQRPWVSKSHNPCPTDTCKPNQLLSTWYKWLNVQRVTAGTGWQLSEGIQT